MCFNFPVNFENSGFQLCNNVKLLTEPKKCVGSSALEAKVRWGRLGSLIFTVDGLLRRVSYINVGIPLWILC